MKKLASSSSVLYLAWLLMMAMSALSQFQNASVLDTKGNPVQNGVKYYIQPTGTNSGGRFTLINRNLSYPLYVGQLNTTLGQGLPVTFMPYAGNNFVEVNQDSRVAFISTTICGQSTQWMVSDTDTTSGRRLIETGSTYCAGDYSNYFRIVQTRFRGIYNIEWCPTEVCPNCRLDCGTIGQLVENGRILEALDGNSPLAVQFVTA